MSSCIFAFSAAWAVMSFWKAASSDSSCASRFTWPGTYCTATCAPYRACTALGPSHARISSTPVCADGPLARAVIADCESSPMRTTHGPFGKWIASPSSSFPASCACSATSVSTSRCIEAIVLGG